MAGDDRDAKRAVAALVDQIGFDTLDVGPLGTGRRFQPGTAAYNVRLDAHELAGALDL
jgi:8-hydroxy-5-deazaflavin:NADPH oxidoreductase